jgi:hypothetical protein
MLKSLSLSEISKELLYICVYLCPSVVSNLISTLRIARLTIDTSGAESLVA